MHTSLQLNILPVCSKPLQEFNAQREEVNFEIMELLNNNNVELAAASTDIIVKQKE